MASVKFDLNRPELAFKRNKETALVQDLAVMDLTQDIKMGSCVFQCDVPQRTAGRPCVCIL